MSAPVEHQHSAVVEEAARWLRVQPVPPSPIVPALQHRFGLSVQEVCEVIALARGNR